MTLRAFVPLALAAALTACSSSSEPTAIQVRAQIDTRWGLTELELTSEGHDTRYPSSAQTLGATETVTILLPDSDAGKSMHIDVWGLAGSARTAHADVTVEPKLHATVDATAALVHLPCGTWCSPQSTSCDADGVRTCEPDASTACFTWSDPVKCASATPFCSLGLCSNACVDECAMGEVRCAGPTGLQRCGNADSDTCLDWMPVEPCGQGEVCNAGVCGKPGACHDDCKLGETQCQDGGVVTCGQFDADDCLDWSPPTRCADGQSCSNGACSATCVDECTENVCDGGVFRECGQFDFDPCKELSSGISCAASACDQGTCDPKAGCSSKPLVCDMPPKSECVDADTLKLYEPSGSCSNGACDYTSTMVSCPNCPNCDPCSGVTCDTPPAPTCVSADSLQTYITPGTCTNGKCTYLTSDTTCNGACENATCVAGIGTWDPTSTVGAPTARGFHTAVWTGTQMIVWGGIDTDLTNTGGRYDPSTDSWQPMSTTGAPDARYSHNAVWTGTEMIVWGGSDNFNVVWVNTGGRYNPTTDTWSPVDTSGAPSASDGHSVVWTGTEMIVWGGETDPDTTNTGARYNPSTDTWTATDTTNAPAARSGHSAVWTGQAMLVWGGDDFGSNAEFNDGGAYDPTSNTWISLSTTGAPKARQDALGIWTGTEMIIWGGDYGAFQTYMTGGRYDPATTLWEHIATSTAASGRYSAAALWMGNEMFVWGGTTDFDGQSKFMSSGARYDPALNAWTPTVTSGAPSARDAHTAVWTGSQVIVWGGYGNQYLDTGSRYTP